MRRKHIVPHRPVIQKAGAARVHRGSYPAAQAGLISRNRAAVAPVVKVAVQVNQAGRDELVRRVQDQDGVRRIQTLGNRGHRAVLKSNVAGFVVNPLGGIQQTPAVQQKIVSCAGHQRPLLIGAYSGTNRGQIKSRMVRERTGAPGRLNPHPSSSRPH